MSLSRVLYMWAKCDGERHQLLQDWLDEAIIKCASSSGQDIASTQANGIAVSFMSSSLTLVEWITALSDAIAMINNPNKANRKAIQIFR